MFKNRFKLSFLFLPIVVIVVVILYIGWKKWFPTAQPSSQKLAIARDSVLLGGNYYAASVPPTRKDSYLSADYRLWVPDSVQTIRGVIIRQHGCGDESAATGLDHANDLQWQALALKHHFALLGTKLPTGNRWCDDWATIDRGSGNAFLKALHAFAKESGHAELETVPWALWGHSGGADWVTQMLQKYPDRTIAAVAMRCGASAFSEPSSLATSMPPLLFAVAEKENTIVDECRDLPKRVFSQYRKVGALWTIAEQANGTHDAGDTRFLAIPYLDAIITARLPMNGTKSNGTKLRAIAATQGWVGNPKTHTITPLNNYQGDSLAAAWLPNEATARQWQNYVTKGKIDPIQKPDAPTQVSAAMEGSSGVRLTWHYTPDLKNGLPSFRIYRDKTLIGTVKGQQHTIGDAPEPPQVALEFLDQAGSITSSYAIAAFNSLGESISQPTQLNKNSSNRTKST